VSPAEQLESARRHLRSAVAEIAAARDLLEPMLRSALVIAEGDADAARRRVESVGAWLLGKERKRA
jgi:hypothetical protein